MNSNTAPAAVDPVCLYVTITKKGQTRYATFNMRQIRTFPLARAKAEAMIAAGEAYVYEIRDYLNGDGKPVRANVIPAVVH